MLPMPPVAESGKRLEVEATGLDEAGAGVGLSGGRTVHVGDLLPGERAEVALEHRSPHKPEDWARVVRWVSAPSADRVPPACRAWGQCGGCAWQHLAYGAQLVHKRARVVEALREAVSDAEERVAAVVPSPAALGYRHKGKYVVGAEPNRRIVLGAWAPRSHTLVDTSRCHVVAPVIEELRERVRLAVEAVGLAPWDERAKTGSLRYVIVRATRDDRALVVLVVRSNADASLLERVARAVAEDDRVAGVLRMDNDRADGALLDGDARVLVGDAAVREVLAGVEVELGAGEFAQVNPAQADAMYARAAALVTGDGARATGAGPRVADVYAGLGGIAFALARAGASVVAIERDESAIGALRSAAERAGLADQIDARAGDASTLAELRDLDAIVVNPPRKGLSKQVVAAMLASSARRVVYMSCGPEALGRDLVLLRDGGFTIETIEPYDLMPGTAQIETIVALTR